MARTFDCWFPELGETRANALTVQAHSRASAAELISSHRCRSDVEWRTHTVAVASCSAKKTPQALFEVIFSAMPHFKAELKKETSND